MTLKVTQIYLTGNYPTWTNHNDDLLGSDYQLTSTPEQFSGMGYFDAESFLGGHVFISPSYKQIKNLVDRFGPVYAHVETVGLVIHAATIIGYGTFDCDRDGDSEKIFWLHETYSDEWNGNPGSQDTRYKCIEANDVSEVLALYDPEWATENHDYRRTGFTLLKGDLEDKSDVRDQVTFFLDAADGGSEQVVKPSIADIDGNGFMDQVVVVHKSSFNNKSRLYGVEQYEVESRWLGTVGHLGIL